MQIKILAIFPFLIFHGGSQLQRPPRRVRLSNLQMRCVIAREEYYNTHDMYMRYIFPSYLVHQIWYIKCERKFAFI